MSMVLYKPMNMDGGKMSKLERLIRDTYKKKFRKKDRLSYKNDSDEEILGVKKVGRNKYMMSHPEDDVDVEDWTGSGSDARKTLKNIKANPKDIYKLKQKGYKTLGWRRRNKLPNEDADNAKEKAGRRRIEERLNSSKRGRASQRAIDEEMFRRALEEL